MLVTETEARFGSDSTSKKMMVMFQLEVQVFLEVYLFLQNVFILPAKSYGKFSLEIFC